MASKTQMERYLAAAVQMSSGADRPANLARAEALVREAAGRGARLVVLPEVFAWRGPRAEEAAVAEPIPGPTTERLAALARELAIHLSAGSLLEKTPDEPRAYNTSCLFDPPSPRHREPMLPDRSGPDRHEPARLRRLWRVADRRPLGARARACERGRGRDHGRDRPRLPGARAPRAALPGARAARGLILRKP